MATGFKKQRVRVCTIGPDGPKPREVDALVKGSYAVHRMLVGEPWVDENGVEQDGTGGGWSVSALPCGLSVKHFGTQAEAKDLVEFMIGENFPCMGKKLGEDLTTGWGPRKKTRFKKAIRTFLRNRQTAF